MTFTVQKGQWPSPRMVVQSDSWPNQFWTKKYCQFIGVFWTNSKPTSEQLSPGEVVGTSIIAKKPHKQLSKPQLMINYGNQGITTSRQPKPINQGLTIKLGVLTRWSLATKPLTIAKTVRQALRVSQPVFNSRSQLLDGEAGKMLSSMTHSMVSYDHPICCWVWI